MHSLDNQILRWTAGLGAVAAVDAARRLHIAPAQARARMSALARRGLMRSHRPLHGRPPLYTVTRPGLRAVGLGALAPARVTPSSYEHAATCAAVAAHLAPLGAVAGEREVRGPDALLAGCALGTRRTGDPLTHRADLLLSVPGLGGLPVEVELTVKAPRRLHVICRSWARNRRVAGVLYVATPRAARAVGRAVARLAAEEIIAVVDLGAVSRGELDGVRGAIEGWRARERCITGRA